MAWDPGQRAFPRPPVPSTPATEPVYQSKSISYFDKGEYGLTSRIVRCTAAQGK